MKKIIAVIFAVLFVVVMPMLGACSEKDDKGAIDEYAGKTFVSDGFYKDDGVAKTYYIYNKAGLTYFNDTFNKKKNNSDIVYMGGTVILENDIEYNGQWLALDAVSGVFNGFTFDGNGHYISGLILNKTENPPMVSTSDKPIGFFGNVQSNVTIKNLTISNASLSQSVNYAKWAGVVVGYHNSHKLVLDNVTVDSCSIITSTANTSAKKIGGLVGLSYNNGSSYMLKLNSCTVKDSTFVGYTCLASFVGTAQGFYAETNPSNRDCIIKITNCTATGNTVKGVIAPFGVYCVDEAQSTAEADIVSRLEQHGCTKSNNTVETYQ